MPSSTKSANLTNFRGILPYFFSRLLRMSFPDSRIGFSPRSTEVNHQQHSRKRKRFRVTRQRDYMSVASSSGMSRMAITRKSNRLNPWVWAGENRIPKTPLLWASATYRRWVEVRKNPHPSRLLAKGGEDE